LLATSFSWWFDTSKSQSAGFSLLDPALAMLLLYHASQLKLAEVCSSLDNHQLKLVASKVKDYF